MRLQNKIAFVTGAASGIGRAVANEFIQQGATVYGADIAASSVGGGAVPVQVDVSSEPDWDRAFERLERLDVFVGAAGIGLAGGIQDITLADWRRLMAVNLDGAFLGVRKAVEVMRRGGGGSIILIGSASGIKAAAGASAYCASKAALRMFAKVVALECKANGIRVNTVSPAGVVTPMWKSMPFWKDLVRDHGGDEGAWAALGGSDPGTPPLQRMAFPEEVAKAVLFLASDDSAYITGIDLVVDAGYTA